MREPLILLLDRYQPIDAADAETKERFLAFVRAEPECFERTLLKGHVTGSSWLVDSSGERVLLTHHRKLDKWLQLGGHADGDSDVLRVACREAEEESGLPAVVPVGTEIFDIDIHLIPARNEVPEHYHYDLRFVLRSEGDDNFVVSDESHDLAWIPIPEIERYTTERSVLRMKEKWLMEHRPRLRDSQPF